MASSQSPRLALGMAGRFFFGSLCAGTFGLGTWQTLRYREKTALIEQRKHDLQQEPVRYCGTGGTDLNTAEHNNHDDFRRIQLSGRFRYEQEFLVGPRGPPKDALPKGPGTSSSGMAAAPQGYLVVTPMALTQGENDDDGAVVVLVNRGWVPMQQVQSGGRNRARHMQGQQEHPHMRRRAEDGSFLLPNSQQDLLQWDRPSGHVTILAVPGKFEAPKFLIAQHDLDENPPKLFWFDLPTMLKLGGIIHAENDNKNHRLVLATQVQDEEQHKDERPQWPVRPTAEAASEFKISPIVHAGYAFTWYSLSMAGVYMTRQLLQRGRR